MSLVSYYVSSGCLVQPSLDLPFLPPKISSLLDGLTALWQVEIPLRNYKTGHLCFLTPAASLLLVSVHPDAPSSPVPPLLPSQDIKSAPLVALGK